MSTTLTFITPPPGFEPSVRFELTAVQDADGLFSLAATEDSAQRLFVVDASIYLPDYAPHLAADQSEALGLTSGEDARVYVVANPAESGTTLNLLAPIVVNAHTNTAAQFILDDRDWPLRAPLGV